MLNLFKDKNEVIRRAMELTKQRARIEKELKVLNSQVLTSMRDQKQTRVTIDGLGSVSIRTTTKKVLNSDKLSDMLSKDPVFFKEYVSSLSSPKQSALEKYIGTPQYTKLVQSTEKSESVVFNLDKDAE